jgi:hypothetical protein
MSALFHIVLVTVVLPLGWVSDAGISLGNLAGIAVANTVLALLIMRPMIGLYLRLPAVSFGRRTSSLLRGLSMGFLGILQELNKYTIPIVLIGLLLNPLSVRLGLPLMGPHSLRSFWPQETTKEPILNPPDVVNAVPVVFDIPDAVKVQLGMTLTPSDKPVNQLTRSFPWEGSYRYSKPDEYFLFFIPKNEDNLSFQTLDPFKESDSKLREYTWGTASVFPPVFYSVEKIQDLRIRIDRSDRGWIRIDINKTPVAYSYLKGGAREIVISEKQLAKVPLEEDGGRITWVDLQIGRLLGDPTKRNLHPLKIKVSEVIVTPKEPAPAPVPVSPPDQSPPSTYMHPIIGLFFGPIGVAVGLLVMLWLYRDKIRRWFHALRPLWSSHAVYLRRAA